MRIFTRRKSGPFSLAIVVLAALFVLGGWIWAARNIPDRERAALQERCTHFLLPMGLRLTRDPAGASRREADYVCLPDYFANPLQYQATTTGDGAPQVRAARNWGPMLFAGVLVLFAAFGIYVRASRRKE